MIRSGIDIIEVDRFEHMEGDLRERFLARILTEKERAYCGDNAQHIAGRFAAKEAISKALGCGLGDISFREMEILPDALGAPSLTLSGNAKMLAEHLGLTDWSVSITHIKETAAAVAIAQGESK